MEKVVVIILQNDLNNIPVVMASVVIVCISPVI